MEADFSGYATRADIKCSDGRTITPDAFKHQDTIEVPLVWQHNHDSPENILGKAILEHRDATHPEGAGIYCYGYFNPDVPNGVVSQALVKHGNVKALSIYANGLLEKAKSVLHGHIREVSLVLSGANPGAFIDNIRLAHSGTGEVETLEDEAIIYTGLEIQHSGKKDDDSSIEHAGDSEGDKGKSYEDIYNAMSAQEKEVVHYMLGEAAAIAAEDDGDDSDKGVKHTADNPDDADDKVEHSDAGDAETKNVFGDKDTTNEDSLTHKEGDTDMARKQFEHGSTDGSSMTGNGIDTSHRISHEDLTTILKAAKRPGGSFKEAVLAHAEEYGITNIDLLFPDAKAITQTPEWISRRMDWVASVLGGTKHTPFAAVKTLMADITADEARAKGYTKGGRKTEEVFSLLQRSTRPATIYKKQKLDRDDMLDITDINVVSWLKAEMRLMIEEELARAILVGDNRAVNNPDRVKDPRGAVDGVGIRSVLHDDPLFAIQKSMPANITPKAAVKELVRYMDEYRGSGAPVMYISRSSLTDLMLEEDRFERPVYADKQALADKIGVSRIVPIDLFSEYEGLYCIIVSLNDYSVGTNAGGELTSFEDFDIDFNQYKYLQETRLSGGLTKPYSAVVVKRLQGALATAAAPSFDGAANEITIPTNAAVDYFIDGELVDDGDEIVITDETTVTAQAAEGNYLAPGTTRSWTFAP